MIVKDLLYGLRTLRRRKGFALVALTSLALGIGANTAVFSLMNAVFLQPLPVARVSQLVSLYNISSDFPGYLPLSQPNFADLRRQKGIFADLAMTFPLRLSLLQGSEPESIDGEMVSANYFDLLGVRLALGRAFLPEEERSASPVVVLSHSLWRARFGGDPRAVGRSLRLNGRQLIIIGIAPPGFHGTDFLLRPAVWLPAGLHDLMMPRSLRPLWDLRRAQMFGVLGRLRPGIRLERARAATQAYADRLASDYPVDNRHLTLAALPLAQAVINPNDRLGYTRAAAVLISMAAIVLLITCANLASLLLVQASGRRREVAVRLAVGVGRWRLVRQLLTESLLLAVIGGSLGLLLAYGAGRALALVRSPYLPAGFHPSTDLRVMGVNLGLSLLTAILFGLAPALQGTKVDLVPALKEQPVAAGPRRQFEVGDLLVAGQVALAFVSTVVAILFWVSLHSVERIVPGFDRDHLALLSFDLDGQAMSDAAGRTFLRRLSDEMRELPEVRSVDVGENLVLAQEAIHHVIQIEGHPEDADIIIQTSSIGPDYFSAMGIPILRGRSFRASDRADSVPVAIVNQTLAERLWPGEDPIGKRFRLVPASGWVEIVGVARDIKYNSLTEPPQLYAYQPIDQSYSPLVTLHVRTQGNPLPVLAAVRRQLQELAPSLALIRAETMAGLIDGVLWLSRAGVVLLSLFAAVALSLVVVGTYGVIAHSVEQRRQEIGLRMAFGAERGRVVWMFLGRGLKMVLPGLVAGLALAWAIAGVASAFFPGIDPRDSSVYAATAVALAGVTVFANYVPVHRIVRATATEGIRRVMTK